MSQHPMTIANQAGAAFRGDLNAQTAAIVTLSSGAAAPSTTYAYMWWADTTAGLLKQRNGANSGWITVGPLDDLGIQSGRQTVGIATGTADAITLAFTPAITAFDAGPKWWRATGANTLTTPTVKRDGLATKTLVKGNNLALAVADIPGAGAWMCSQYDAGTDREVLLNPAKGVSISTPPAYTPPTSVVRVNTSNGYGSTNTAIRRFTNIVTNAGTDITYADSAANGGSFTINTTGLYGISFSDAFTSAGGLGITLNGTALSTVIFSVATAEIVAAASASTNYPGNCAAIIKLTAGDVIRAQTDKVAGANTNLCQFVISRIY